MADVASRILRRYCVIEEERVEGEPGATPPPAWPSQGAISFKDVSMRSVYLCSGCCVAPLRLLCRTTPAAV